MNGLERLKSKSLYGQKGVRANSERLLTFCSPLRFKNEAHPKMNGPLFCTGGETYRRDGRHLLLVSPELA